MASMVSLVIFDPSKVDEVVQEWVRSGVTGLTLVDTSGWIRAPDGHALRDDLPLMPSVRNLLRGEEERSRLIFSIIPDEFDVEPLVEGAERVLGPLDQPRNGILFVIPLSHVVGLRPPLNRDAPSLDPE